MIQWRFPEANRRMLTMTSVCVKLPHTGRLYTTVWGITIRDLRGACNLLHPSSAHMRLHLPILRVLINHPEDTQQTVVELFVSKVSKVVKVVILKLKRTSPWAPDAQIRTAPLFGPRLHFGRREWRLCAHFQLPTHYNLNLHLHIIAPDWSDFWHSRTRWLRFFLAACSDASSPAMWWYNFTSNNIKEHLKTLFIIAQMSWGQGWWYWISTTDAFKYRRTSE